MNMMVANYYMTGVVYDCGDPKAAFLLMNVSALLV